MTSNEMALMANIAVDMQKNEVNEVLDKIRAEIEELDRYYDNDYFSSNKDPMYKCNEVSQIIDKYRDKEQEDNGFFDEIMGDESDGEVYEKIKEIIDKVKE